MNRLSVIVAFVGLVASACVGSASAEDSTTSSTSGVTTSPTTVAPGAVPGDPTEDGPDVMGLALRQLVSEDNTFGAGYRFDTVLIQSHTDPAAGSGTGTAAGRLLTDAERSVIEAMVGEVSSVQWIDDPAEWRTEDLRPVVEGSAIIGVGEVVYDAEGALVPVSLWCGGLCGTWFTYRLQVVDGAWAVTGIEGPIAIS